MSERVCADSGCGHSESYHRIHGRCVWTLYHGRPGDVGARVDTCFCGEFRESAASPGPPLGTPIYVDSQEEPIGYVADQCHAVLWLEPGPVLDHVPGPDGRTRLVCRFATGHTDPFHEHYDGTRWMVQTEDR